jgi:hypothetical protein
MFDVRFDDIAAIGKPGAVWMQAGEVRVRSDALGTDADVHVVGIHIK